MALAFAAGAGLMVLDRTHRVAPGAGHCGQNLSPMRRVELVFGMARKQGSEISDDDWRTFLADDVTPRFPDGLTVLNGFGQWRSADGGIVHEASRVLLIWYPAARDAGPDVDAIRAAWKRRHGQESVLRADG